MQNRGKLKMLMKILTVWRPVIQYYLVNSQQVAYSQFRQLQGGALQPKTTQEVKDHLVPGLIRLLEFCESLCVWEQTLWGK